MANEEFLKQIKKKGINPDDLTSDDIYTLIELSIKGEFGKEVLKEFIKENNISYKTYVEGLGKFSVIHKASSDKYIEILDFRMKDLSKQAENVKTVEEKEKIDINIDGVLDRFEREANANRDQGRRFALIAGGMATILAGSTIFLVTRNPEVFKKGVAMIAGETVNKLIK